MSSRKDPFWEHVVKIKTDEWKCNYCKGTYKGRPIRIKAHLGGIRGRGVDICNSFDLPPDVRRQAAEAIEKKKDLIDHVPEDTFEEIISEPSNKRQRGSDFVDLTIQPESPPSDIYHAFVGSQVHPSHHTTDSTQQHNLEHDSHHRQELPLSLALGRKVMENSFFNLPVPHLVGREFFLNLEIILRDLGRNGANIGIYGMGGVGKTALLLNLHNRICSNGNFGDVLWVTVPKDASIYELQEEIARELKVHDLLKDVRDVRKRAAILWKNLSSKGDQCIILLDDLWQHYEFREVGIPLGGDSGLRLVLTTRSLRVCHQMQCKKMIKIEPLHSEEESFNLFKEHLKVQSLSPQVKQIALSIVRWCDGLPLAIVAIARSMRGEGRVYSWKVALNRLEEGSNEDEVMEKDVIMSLKRSYDMLPSRMQQCFLRCALWPFETESEVESETVSELKLREFFIDEELIGESNSRKMKHMKGQQILDQLKSSCLLDFVADGYVEMHRLVRRTALYIMSRSCPSTIESNVENEGLPDNKSWACEQVLSLMLNFSKGLSGISSSFFQPLSNLKYLNLSGTDIIDLPPIISGMIQLKALVLSDCEGLRFIPCLEKLKLLRKLDLAGCCSLSNAPLGLESLVNLTYLDLGGTDILSLEMRVLSKLVQLQFLRLEFTIWEEAVRLNNIEVIHCFSHEDSHDIVAYLKTSKGKACKFYKAIIDDVYNDDGTQADDYYLYQDSDESGKEEEDEFNNEVFTMRKQVSIIHNIGEKSLLDSKLYLPARPHLVSLVQRQRMRLDDDNGGKRLDFSPCRPDEETTNSLWIVKQVQEEISLPSSQLRYSLRKLNVKVPTLNYLFSVAATVYLENLRHLTVESCRKLEGIVAAGSIIPSGALRELKTMSIYGCDTMKTVVGIELVSHLKKLQLIQVWECDNIDEIVATSPQLHVGATFESLTKLLVSGCSKIRTLLKYELLLQLPKLEELDVRNCDEMDEIIGQPSMMITDGGNPLPTLKRLYLDNLPRLKHVYDGGLYSNRIITVHITKCQSLKKFPFRIEAPPSPPPCIEKIVINMYELHWWKSLEWDPIDTMDILEPYLQLQ